MTDQKIFLRMNTGVHTASMGGFLVANDGSYFVSMSNDRTIRVWDSISQREVRQFRGHIGHGNDGALGAIGLSPDNKYLLSAAHSAQEPHTNQRLRIYDFESGDLLRSLGDWGIITGLDFSADQRFLIITRHPNINAEVYDAQKFLTTFDREKSLIATIDCGDQEWGLPMQFTISEAEGKIRIATTYWELVKHQNSFKIHEFDTQTFESRLIKHIESRGRRPTMLSCNHEHVAFQYNEDKWITVVDWDGSTITEFEADSHPYALRYSPDGTMLLSGYRGENGACTVYAADDDYRPVTQFMGHKSSAPGTAFLNNRTVVTGGGDDNEIFIWTPQTGELRGKIEGRGEAVFAVGRQGNLIGFGNTQNSVPLKNNYAPLERVIDLANFDIFDINDLIDVDFKRIEPSHNGLTIRLADAHIWINDVRVTSNLEATHPDVNKKLLENGEFYGDWFGAQSFGFTEDGIALLGAHYGPIFAVHVDESKGLSGITFVAHLRGHSSPVWDMVVQGNRLVTCGADQVLRIWNLDEIPRPKNEEEILELKKFRAGEAKPIDPILNLFFTNDNQWIVWSKSGFYDASLHGDELIGFHVSHGEDKTADFYLSDRFAHTLYRPDVIREIIECGSEEQALKKFGLADVDIADILPPTISYEGKLTQSVDQPTIPLSFQVRHPQDQPLSRVMILINEIPVWEWEADNPGDVNAHDDEVFFNVPDLLLVPGKNSIQITAQTKLSRSNPLNLEVFSTVDETDAGSRGSQDKSDKNLVRIKPNLYLLAIGVSKYKHGEDKVKGKAAKPGVLYNLNFCDKDALAVDALFKGLEGSGFSKVDTTVLTNEQATKKNIEKAVKDLGQKIEARSRQKRSKKWISRDVAVVFMAGHGVQSENVFYFLNHDVDPKKIDSTAVQMLEIGETINKFRSEVIMLTDACHSGQIGENLNNRELTKSWKEISGRAQVIFNATTADNISVEHQAWGHGAFTKSIIDVVSEERDRWLLQFFPDVSNQVREITTQVDKKTKKVKWRQKPTLTILGVMEDFRLKRHRSKK